MNELREPLAETAAARPVNGSMSSDVAGVRPGTRWSSLSTVVRPSEPITIGIASICSRASPYSSAISSSPERGLVSAGCNCRMPIGGNSTGMPGSTSKGSLRHAV